MAYHQDHFYNGPSSQRPPVPQQYLSGPGPQQQQQRPHGYLQDGNSDSGYQGQHGGPYGQRGYGGGYDDINYERGGPPPPGQGRRQEMNGPPRGRSGHPAMRGAVEGARRSPGGGGGRFGPMEPSGSPGRDGYGPPPGRGGRPMQMDRGPVPDPNSSRRPPIGPQSPGDIGFGSPFPSFPGQQRRTDLQQEQQILEQMSNMEITGGSKPSPNVRRQGSGRSDYGPTSSSPMDRPVQPPRGYAPQGAHSGPSGRGMPPTDYRPEYRDDGYGPGPGPQPAPRGPPMGPPGPGPRRTPEFAGPDRSMTMPMGNRNGGIPPQRKDSSSSSFSGPPRQQMPPRPSTATGNRPALQRSYTAQTAASGPLGLDAQFDAGYGPPEDQWRQGHLSQGPSRDGRASLDDFYDYYNQGRSVNASDYQPNGRRPTGPSADYQPDMRQSVASDMPDFDAVPQGPSSRVRDSLDQHLMAAAEEEHHHHSGPNRAPAVTRTKSHPNLRPPQQAVLEMAGEVPPMPAQYQQGRNDQYGGGYHGQYSDQYQDGQGYQQQPPLGPGLAGGPGSMKRPGQSPPGQRPAPVRPGLMPDSVVNQAVNRTPPVRMHTQPPSHQQQQMPMQGPPPPRSAPPPSEASRAPEEPPVTTEELEQLRARVKTDPNDQQTALRMAKKLVEASEVLIPNVADPKTRHRARDRYVMDAHKILKKLANAQNPDAMFFLADCHGKGLFVNEPDNKEAFTLYQSAAKLNNAAAAYRTAVCCEIGHEEGGGTRKDPLKALQWYKRAATLGDTPAMYKVGMIQLKGLLGQPRNPREAVSWLKRAAERADAANPHSLHELGLLYENAQPNDAIVRDEAYALTLFSKAAELGYKFSQFRLGAAFEFGLMGCPIDPRQSILWYSRAATQEEHQSELALSGWYLTGSEGVLAQSDTEAYLWARKAAMAGLSKAEYAMGYFTEVGIGVPANLEDAKRWYWRAAAQDFPKARERLEDIKRMGKNGGPRQREKISRSKIGPPQEHECSVM